VKPEGAVMQFVPHCNSVESISQHGTLNSTKILILKITFKVELNLKFKKKAINFSNNVRIFQNILGK
jgi:hypothetical protein